MIDAGQIPAGHSQVVTLSNGAEIVVRSLGGTLYHEVEGTMSTESYARLMAMFAHVPTAERDARVGAEIKKALGKMGSQARAIALRETPEVAYFTFMLPYTPEVLGALKHLRFDQTLLLNPVVLDRDSLAQAKAHTPASLGLVPLASPRGDTERYSGLARIHEPEFRKQALADIGVPGVAVDGSSVRLGITDTGLTLNHPNFTSRATSKTRVQYLKDFTREGRVYFNPAAKLEVAAGAGAEDLTLQAQIIVTPKLPDLPAGDQLVDVKDFKIKVSSELRQILLTSGSGAKLGAVLEESLNGETDKVDINVNGKLDDKLWVIYVPGPTPLESFVYFDSTGTGDFRRAKALGDWNRTGASMKVHSELVGFELKADKLPKADGSGTLELPSASIVGYDPGNHGSHVAGIAAGKQTIANDIESTMARGVAPEAQLLMNRVCSNTSGCGYAEAIVDMALNSGAELINMSLGGLSPFNDGLGVQEAVINRLTSVKNVLFVISAGNSGPGHQTVGSPSVARFSLSVGATATQGMIQRQYQYPGSSGASGKGDLDSDFMLFFSSRGPTAAGGFKPNVTAPGTELSSVQLNAAPGAHSGLDVYWGTSMAAPTAAGAYALLLDAAKKFNQAHPDRKLTTNALALRAALIESARAFDVTTLDPETGARTQGRYTWVDQGKGMIDLLAAWELLKKQAAKPLASAVKRADGTSVELDYQTIVQFKQGGAVYDGSRAAAPGTPALGSGVYLEASGTQTLIPVLIARRLPESDAKSAEAGDLAAQLSTTSDEFVLKTVIHGSDTEWVRAGTLERTDCWESERGGLSVLGRGVEIAVKPDGTAEEISIPHASALNVCLSREAMSGLAPGEHGALIEAYRKVGEQVAEVASFTVPVYVTIPQRRLELGAGYSTEQTVRSFEVSRNYVVVPEGTRMVRITLEVPALKAGESCSGVELMSLHGGNTIKPFKKRPEARVANCTIDGAIETRPEKRKLVFSTAEPKAGLWDIHVFGQYIYSQSRFKLTVDYVNAVPTPERVETTMGTGALSGRIALKIAETSLATALPAASESSFELTGLYAETAAQVAAGEHVFVAQAGGSALHKYPAGTTRVTITTGGSAGNDIDLTVLECAETATSPEDASCVPAAQSGGATDVESAELKPKAGKLYAVRIDGYAVKDSGKFASTETIELAAEKGQLTIAGQAPDFVVGYALSAEQVATSPLLTSELARSGQFAVTGALRVRTADGTLLSQVPVRLKASGQ